MTVLAIDFIVNTCKRHCEAFTWSGICRTQYWELGGFCFLVFFCFFFFNFMCVGRIFFLWCKKVSLNLFSVMVSPKGSTPTFSAAFLWNCFLFLNSVCAPLLTVSSCCPAVSAAYLGLEHISLGSFWFGTYTGTWWHFMAGGHFP